MRFYDVELESGGASRTVRVSSPTDVQAADAAAPLMKSGDRILGIEEVEDDGLQRADAPPPLSQAAELADATPGAAAKSDRSSANQG
ncbi:hypothetical protein EGY25_03005 [Brevundimonas intermedia]|uniref:Uncharacterized protein n=1 Tax=Brevundimonas intermedia TaxID=74315 RepID=A0A4Y9RYU8_9CAUL|nr:hypothetical protein [Brevundimonas intermedia]TFW14192.1 hypothetical protein EGY25_03005 [Brevundimonas intermedia]